MQEGRRVNSTNGGTFATAPWSVGEGAIIVDRPLAVLPSMRVRTEQLEELKTLERTIASPPDRRAAAISRALIALICGAVAAELAEATQASGVVRDDEACEEETAEDAREHAHLQETSSLQS